MIGIGTRFALFAQDSSFLGLTVPEDFDIAQNLAFAVIAALMIYMSFKMVTTGNVVHAALYLVIVLAGSAAMFILLGSDFVGATQILVYIGAIVVLFLFGIMLTKAQLGDDDSVEHERRTMGAGVAVLLFVVLATALVQTFGADDIEFSNPEPIRYEPTEVAVADLATPVVEALPSSLTTGVETITISAEDFGNLEPEVQRRVPGAEVFGNNKQIADSIFSEYIVAFEAVSVLLLAALIGAVVVARKE